MKKRVRIRNIREKRKQQKKNHLKNIGLFLDRIADKLLDREIKAESGYYRGIPIYKNAIEWEYEYQREISK